LPAPKKPLFHRAKSNLNFLSSKTYKTRASLVSQIKNLNINYPQNINKPITPLFLEGTLEIKYYLPSKNIIRYDVEISTSKPGIL
jgi:hypothetical protein